jgi:hypothetical protein
VLIGDQPRRDPPRRAAAAAAIAHGEQHQP